MPMRMSAGENLAGSCGKRPMYAGRACSIKLVIEFCIPWFLLLMLKRLFQALLTSGIPNQANSVPIPVLFAQCLFMRVFSWHLNCF